MGASLGTEGSVGTQPGSHLKSNLTCDVTVSELIHLAEKHTCQPLCVSDRLSVSLDGDSDSRLAEVPGRSGGRCGMPRTPRYCLSSAVITVMRVGVIPTPQ